MSPEGRAIRPVRRLAGLVLCLLLLSPAGLPAADPAPAAELQQVRERLQSLRASLKKDRAEESDAQKELRRSEQAVARASGSLRQLDQQLAQRNLDITRLRGERDTELRRLEALQHGLARQVRAAYMMGKQGQVKLLLNQQDPATLERVRAYYQYLNRAQVAGIEDVNSQLARLDTLEKDIAEQHRALLTLRGQREAEVRTLDHEREQRAGVLSRLRDDIRRKGREVEELQRDEARLQDLVRRLQRALADIPAESRGQPFPRLKGKLPWPAAGRLEAGFGQDRAEGKLKWRGVLIGAPRGSDVRAVSHGRVAFADWLRGFGLILIVDHGDGYMSLYGQNQALHKEVGEWVAAGEVVASVGDSGGRDASGLYFELRQNGKPVDPLAWCAGRPAAATASR